MNTVLLVGRVKETHVINEHWATLELEVQNEFKNSDGEYTKQTFTIDFYNGLGNYIEHLGLKQNEVISVVGRLENRGSLLTIIGHKITKF